MRRKDRSSIGGRKSLLCCTDFRDVHLIFPIVYYVYFHYTKSGGTDERCFAPILQYRPCVDTRYADWMFSLLRLLYQILFGDGSSICNRLLHCVSVRSMLLDAMERIFAICLIGKTLCLAWRDTASCKQGQHPYHGSPTIYEK